MVDGIRRQLRGEYQVVTATGGAQALTLIDQQPPFEVIISDYNMPGMNGIEFLREAHQKRAQSSLIMLTGRAELDVAVEALHRGNIFRFLRKPCPREDLKKAVEDGIGQYQLIESERRLTRELQVANQQLNQLNNNLEGLVTERTETIARLNGFVTQLNGLDSVEDIAGLVVESVLQLLNSSEVKVLLTQGRQLKVVASSASEYTDDGTA